MRHNRNSGPHDASITNRGRGAVVDDWARRRPRAVFNVAARRGWHRHHLLPNHLLRYPDLRDFVGELADPNIWLGDFPSNGMFLPAEEAIARAVRLPLHRGSHRTYNAMVIDALDDIQCGTVRLRLGLQGRIAAIRGLQRRLRTLLQQSAVDTEVVLAGRDPFGPSLAALDLRTDAMFADTMVLSGSPAHLPSADCAAASRAIGTR